MTIWSAVARRWYRSPQPGTAIRAPLVDFEPGDVVSTGRADAQIAHLGKERVDRAPVAEVFAGVTPASRPSVRLRRARVCLCQPQALSTNSRVAVILPPWWRSVCGSLGGNCFSDHFQHVCGEQTVVRETEASAATSKSRSVKPVMTATPSRRMPANSARWRPAATRSPHRPCGG